METEQSQDRFVYIEDLGKFDLSRIWDTFEVAEFERRTYRMHVIGIKKALAKKRLIDFIITVYRLNESKKWKVIDGQHRLIALYELHEEGKLKSFPLSLRVINAKNEQEAREIYISMNSGKPLLSIDVLKAYDNGNIYFFNELRNTCLHDGSKEKIAFVTCLSAMYYVKYGDAMRKVDIEEFLGTLQKWEVLRMKELVQTMYHVCGNNAKSNIFFANVFRPLARLYFEVFKDATGKKWERLIGNLDNDTTVKANKGKWTIESCDMMYNYLKKKWERMQ